MSLLRGPMTRNEIKQALDLRRKAHPSRSRVPAVPTAPVEAAPSAE
jgi:hypothetical protein